MIVMDNTQSFYCDAKYQQGQNIMKEMIRIIPLLAICFLTFLTSTIKAEGGNSNNYLQSVITAIDYHTRNIYLFNYENDKLIIINPFYEIPGWSEALPLQHTVVIPEVNKIFITTDNTKLFPSFIGVLKVNNIDWDKRKAELELEDAIMLDTPDTPPLMAPVLPINNNQAIPNWLVGRGTQIHGPTLLPGSDLLYHTEFTSDRVRVLNYKTNQLIAGVDPIVIENYTEQTHGVNFNNSGSIGLGTGYFFDNNIIDVYKPNKITGELTPIGQIKLGSEERYAALTHFTYWLDERYAVTATMQLDKTSITPSTTKEIIPPSVWLLDAIELTATKIISSTDSDTGHGIYRSASDIAFANGKLYIAEEDSLHADEFGRDGFVSIFDLSDRYNPKFIKRLKPGPDLPKGFAVSHALSPSPDERYMLAASWVSGYVIKIDTATDKVVKIWGPSDGLVKPHGLFAAGNRR